MFDYTYPETNVFTGDNETVTPKGVLFPWIVRLPFRKPKRWSRK